MFKGNLYGKAERMEKIYSRIVRIVSIIIIGYLFLQGLFTICNMQRVTEQVYYMKNNPWRQLLCIGIVVLLCLAARKCKVKEFLERPENRRVVFGFWQNHTSAIAEKVKKR